MDRNFQQALRFNHRYPVFPNKQIREYIKVSRPIYEFRYNDHICGQQIDSDENQPMYSVFHVLSSPTIKNFGG